MKNLLKKMGSKQKLTIRVIIIIFIISMVGQIVSKQNSFDNVKITHPIFKDEVTTQIVTVVLEGKFSKILY